MEKEMISQTSLDQMVGDESSQFLKAAIPYLPPSTQPLFSIYAKAKELQNTLELFRSGAKDMKMCSSAPAPEPLEMLDDIRRFCYGESRAKLDQMIRILGTVQMLQLMKEP